MNPYIKSKIKASYYLLIKTKNSIKKNLLKQPQERSYIFILTPPLSGSTMLVDILSTSKSVSINNNLGTKEGQTLPEVKKIMFDSPDRWDETKDFDWKFIKDVWLKYWDVSRSILLEKSPANILRAHSIQKAFKPCKFIISYRNPYAQCESIIRRGKQSVDYAANFAILCLKHQKKNIETLADKSLVMSYEEITESPQLFKQKLVTLLPELSDISLDHKIRAHNISGSPMNIKNLNDKKIESLTDEEIEGINKIFNKNLDLLNYFNYKIINRV